MIKNSLTVFFSSTKLLPTHYDCFRHVRVIMGGERCRHGFCHLVANMTLASYDGGRQWFRFIGSRFALSLKYDGTDNREVVYLPTLPTSI